ncbi:Zinc finger RNA-binding-like protein [Daphnia magna]|uniref:Zinc finger RNA-binding-like protein n=1 Tax=Daphnia magna TaxID=35525 RepID=A0A162RBT7_9CRUS|nr:Zinc finger RNA-binding-like protein [Daphnia magna]
MVPTPRTGAGLHCELCNVACTSADAYAAHIRGTKHQKVVELHTKLGKLILSAEPQLIHLKTGGATGTAPATPVTTTTIATIATMVSAVITTLAVTTTSAATAATPTLTVPAPTCTTAVVKVVAATPKINFLGTNCSFRDCLLLLQANQIIKKEEVPMTAAVATETAQAVVVQWEEEKVIQPVGQDYVEELRGGDDCRFYDVNAKDMHLKGRRLRIMYKKKVDLNLVVEAKGNENYEEMPQGSSSMEDGNQPRPPAYWASPSRGGLRHGGISMGLPPPPEYFPSGSLPMGIPNPAMRKPESSDDRHVMAKHSEIYPSWKLVLHLQVEDGAGVGAGVGAGAGGGGGGSAVAGKENGEAVGYQLAQLQDLEYGTILKVGGREVLGVPLEVEHPPGLGSSQDVLNLLDNNQQNANTSFSSTCSPEKNASYQIQSATEPPLLKALK